MVNLIIDIGNSRTKVALYNQGELMISFPVSQFSVNDLNILLSEYPGIEKAIISSVKESDEELLSEIKQKVPHIIELTYLTPLPVKNSYETPKTLGKDRIAAAIGAYKLFPDQNIMVIDAGTAITYDFITSEGVYTGGFITPGLRMRFMALNHFTDKLPLLEPSLPTEIEGTNTISSITGGVQYGIEGEIERMIEFYTSRHNNFQIVFTGGDADYLRTLIKKGTVNPELTFIGLNEILEFNFNK